LGSTATAGFSAMLNLIGEFPESAEVLSVSNTHLHLYGKSPRPGRKLGHVTVRADHFEKLQQRLAELPSFFHRPEFCLEQVQSSTLANRA
jgi:5-(carboxyamino)imidazole ribonucleotide synthase